GPGRATRRSGHEGDLVARRVRGPGWRWFLRVPDPLPAGPAEPGMERLGRRDGARRRFAGGSAAGDVRRAGIRVPGEAAHVGAAVVAEAEGRRAAAVPRGCGAEETLQ